MAYTTAITTTKANVEALITNLTGSETIDDLRIIDKASIGLDCSNYATLEAAIELLIDTQTSSTNHEDILLSSRMINEQMPVGAIKSIQRGVVNSSVGTVTIASVDTSKAVVNLLTVIAYGSTSNRTTHASISLTDSTTLTIDAGNYISTVDISWEVIEYV